MIGSDKPIARTQGTIVEQWFELLPQLPKLMLLFGWYAALNYTSDILAGIATMCCQIANRKVRPSSAHGASEG